MTRPGRTAGSSGDPRPGEMIALALSVVVLVALAGLLVAVAGRMLGDCLQVASALPEQTAARLRTLTAWAVLLFGGFFVLGALAWQMAVRLVRRVRVPPARRAGLEEALLEISRQYSLSRSEMRKYGEQLRREVEKGKKRLSAVQSELAETEAQLAQAERLAALGQMAAGIAHEVRNPLGIINSAAYYLRDAVDPADAEAAEQVRIIEREVARMEDTVHSLLSFARMSASYEPSAVRLAELVGDALGAVRAAGRLEGIDVKVDVPEDMPAVWVDGEQITRVFVNLFENAAFAMEGKGTLSVTSRVDRAGRMAVISVSDTGRGIEPEHLDRIFDLFYTTKKVGEGTGLGLAICKGIVERAGGSISVESAPGQGATFTVRLPLAPAPPGGRREQDSTLGAKGNTSAAKT